MNLTAKFRPGWIGYFRSLVVIVLAVSVMAAPLWAADKTDEIWLKNGDHLTGEIKKLQLGVFYFKPKYALNSIEIDWTQVDRIETVERFNVIFTNGETHSGVIRKAPEKDGAMDFTINDDGQTVATEKLEVVNIQPQKSSFLAQLNGSIDYGFSYVSGNNQLQSSLGANAAYRGEKNQMSTSLSSSFSGQSDAEDTTRESWTSDYSRILTPKYFVTGLERPAQQQPAAAGPPRHVWRRIRKNLDADRQNCILRRFRRRCEPGKIYVRCGGSDNFDRDKSGDHLRAAGDFGFYQF